MEKLRTVHRQKEKCGDFWEREKGRCQSENPKPAKSNKKWPENEKSQRQSGRDRSADRGAIKSGPRMEKHRQRAGETEGGERKWQCTESGPSGMRKHR